MAKIKYVPASQLLLHDRRMLQLMVFVITNKLKGVTGEVEFLNIVGSPNKGNISAALKNGKQHFVIADVKRACEIFGADANFFFLENHVNMFRKGIIKTPFEMLLVAVQAVGLEMGAFTPLTEGQETEAQKLKRSVDMIEKEEKRKEAEAEKIRKIVEAEEHRKKTNFEWI